MKIKCEYCGNLFEDTSEKCSVCGAPNDNYRSNKENRSPKTIDELKGWYESRNLPPENETRFFIGKDIKEPRAFGIYKDQDTDEFIVYKNKNNGERAIRYRGKDEAYAVNELYLKLKSEIINQKRLIKIKNESKVTSDFRKVKKSFLCLCIIAGLFLVSMFVPKLIIAYMASVFVTLIFLVIWALIFNGTAYEFKHGWQLGAVYVLFATIIFFVLNSIDSSNTITYYKYDGVVYCHAGEDYYRYDDEFDDYSLIGSKDWLPVELRKNPDAYEWDGYSYNFTEFTDSKYFEENFGSSSDSDWNFDSDFDWDSGDSWDSGGMDWDSDW